MTPLPATHRIRLHGPWHVRPLTGDRQPLRVTIPTTLRAGGLTGYAGPILFSRRFGCPSNLTASDRVWLIFEAVVGAAEVSLNGERLGRVDGSGRLDVTSRLRERNEIDLVIDAPDDGAGIVGEVVLEIVAG